MSEIMEDLKNQAAALIEALPGAEWEYDERFITALYCYEIAKHGQVETVLTEMFENGWDYKSYKKGSKSVKKLVKELSGLQKGQLLHTTGDELLIYAVLWPWGDGTTVSLRIGLYSLKDKEFNEKGSERFVKEWFGLK